MKKQVIFFDVDGTLVDGNTGIISPSTKKALKQLKDVGHLVCIATGRSICSLQEGGFLEILNWDGYVCNTGQMIYDRHLQLIQEQYIDTHAVQACMQLAKEDGLVLLLEGVNQAILTAQPNAYVMEAYEFLHETLDPVMEYDGFPVIMMEIFAPVDYDYHRYEAIQGIHVIPGMSAYADVVMEHTSKYEGINILLDSFHAKEYICFGDSLNDIEMASHASFSICMGNGHSTLKACSDYITTDVNDDGIYNACKALHLF